MVRIMTAKNSVVQIIGILFLIIGLILTFWGIYDIYTALTVATTPVHTAAEFGIDTSVEEIMQRGLFLLVIGIVLIIVGCFMIAKGN